MNGLALCAGVGGLELGLHIALGKNYRTICYVERETFAASTLVARMEDEALDSAPIWDDIKTFDGLPWRGKVDILTGGYPCQPFSVAGKRAGTSDSRHLWPDFKRIIGEVQPSVIFLENVAGHLKLGFSEVGRELLEMGYRVEVGIFSAEEGGAPHKRERMFILAMAEDSSSIGWGRGDYGDTARDNGEVQAEGLCLSVGSRASFPPRPDEFEKWERVLEGDPSLEPALRRGSDGLAYRVDRLRASGNGVVPVCATVAFLSLVEKLREE